MDSTHASSQITTTSTQTSSAIARVNWKALSLAVVDILVVPRLDHANAFLFLVPESVAIVP